MTAALRKTTVFLFTWLFLAIFLTSPSDSETAFLAEQDVSFGDFVIESFHLSFETDLGTDLTSKGFMECSRKQDTYTELDNRILIELDSLFGEKVRIFDIPSQNKDLKKKSQKFQRIISGKGFPSDYLILSSSEGKMTGIILLSKRKKYFEKPITRLFGKESLKASRFWFEKKTSVSAIQCSPFTLWKSEYPYLYLILERNSIEKIIDPALADLSEKGSADSLKQQLDLAEEAFTAGKTYPGANEKDLSSIYDTMKKGYLACQNVKDNLLNISPVLEDHNDLNFFFNTFNIISYTAHLQEYLEKTVKERLKAETSGCFDRLVTEENIINHVKKLKLKGYTYEDNSPLVGETYSEKKFLGKGKFKKAEWSSEIPDKNGKFSLLYLHGLDTIENPNLPLTLVVTWPHFEGNISVNGADCRAGITFRSMLPLLWGREITEPDHYRVMGFAGIGDVFRNGKVQRGNTFFDDLYFAIYGR